MSTPTLCRERVDDLGNAVDQEDPAEHQLGGNRCCKRERNRSNPKNDQHDPKTINQVRFSATAASIVSMLGD
jgi:hypothetical protein